MMECVVLGLQVERFRPVVETCRNLCCNSLLNIAVSLISEVFKRHHDVIDDVGKRSRAVSFAKRFVLQ